MMENDENTVLLCKSFDLSICKAYQRGMENFLVFVEYIHE